MKKDIGIIITNKDDVKLAKRIVSNRFKIGSKWKYKYYKDVEREIASEFGRYKVKMTNGQVFSKIFLTKHYTPF